MYTYNAMVSRIIDGGIFECLIDLGFGVSLTKKINLAGVDLPSRNSPILLEREISAKAISRANYTLQNRRVIVETFLDENDFDKVWAYVYDNEKEQSLGQSYNLKLIQDNLANPIFDGKKHV